MPSYAAGPEIERLIQLLAKLPGLGPRSARRAALTLLKKRDQLLEPLSLAMREASAAIRTCADCGNLDTTSPCSLCRDPRRDPAVLCIVEDVADLWALERAAVFRGRYHVLGGALSALDGVTPERLNVARLLERVRDGIDEVILAMNATVEGQTTAHYLVDAMANSGVKVTRLAHGVPVGGELDYLDEGTLSAAFKARRAMMRSVLCRHGCNSFRRDHTGEFMRAASLLFTAFLLSIAAPCSAADAPAAAMATPATPVPAGPRLLIQTSMGDITLALDQAHAPETVANVLRYAREGHYDGTAIYRVAKGFVIQMGSYDAKGQYRPTRDPIPLEANNGLSNTRGAVAMARLSEPASATADFFIDLADNAGLDRTASDTGNTTGYAVFGHVIAGMDVVDRIAEVPVGNNGPMPGQAPVDPIVVTKVSILPDAAP